MKYAWLQQHVSRLLMSSPYECMLGFAFVGMKDIV